MTAEERQPSHLGEGAEVERRKGAERTKAQTDTGGWTVQGRRFPGWLESGLVFFFF